MSTLSVSSYSVREQLGPLSFSYIDPRSGEPGKIEFPFPKLFGIGEYPARARNALGVQAIETCQFQFGGLDDPELIVFEESLRESGVKLINVAIDSGDLLNPDEVARAADIEEQKRWIARFAELGSAFVRVNPGSPFSAHANRDIPEYLVQSLIELGGYANERGTRLLVENHGGPSSDPVWMTELLERVGNEHLGLLLDLGNFEALGPVATALTFGGEVPDLASLDLSSVYAGIDALAPRAELVHAKSHLVEPGGAVGPVDLEEALRILRGHGFDGPITVEYEGVGGDPWAKCARVLEVLADPA